MTRLHTWLIGLLLGGLTVWLLVLGWIDRERDRATAIATEARVAWVADSSRLAEVRRGLDVRQRSDSLARAAAEQQAAAAHRQAEASARDASKLRRQLDTLRTSVDSVPVLVQIVAQQDTTIHHLSAQATHLGTALEAEIRRSARLTLSLAAADSATAAAQRRIQVLDGLVRTPPAVPRGKLFGFLPPPKCGIGAAIVIGPDEGINPRPAVACVVGL